MYDKEIGMYYLIARYYNPEHGVFLSVDPDPGDADDPVTMNGYTYGDNNPVMKVDPDGHWAYPSWGTTPLWVSDKRTAYANDRGVRAGIKGWIESYSFNTAGIGNFASKLGPFLTGANKGWKQSKTKSNVKASQVKVGNRTGVQSVLKNASKQATKAAIVSGSKR